MVPDRIPLNGVWPDLKSRNIDTNAEPKSHARSLEKKSEVHVPARNLQKADHDLHMFRNMESLQKEGHSIFEDRSVLFRGFSIREYVGKVRSLDIKKCWPFPEGLLNERLKEGRNKLLPPLESPDFRWLACQHCLQNAGKHTDIGTLFDRQQILNTESKNNTNKVDKMIDGNLTVSLDTHSDEDSAISQDLQEQIRKLTTFQISTQEENVAKDGKRRMESTEEMLDDMGRKLLPSSVRFTNGKLEASKCTSKVCKRRKSDASLQQAPENENRNKECDATLHKVSANQSQVQNFKSDLVQRNSGLLNGLNVVEDETQKTRMVRSKAQDEALAQVVSRVSERNDNLNLEAATELDSDKKAICDINNAECSGQKICPVCKTFTSSTITAVNGHMDSCLALANRIQGKRQKQKSRARKKRSIVEICAVAPPIRIPVNYLGNTAMNESEGSQGTGICSHEATTSLNLKENISLEAGAEATVDNDFPSPHCKGKEATQACALIETRIAKGGQTKSLETKRKRQQASKDVKEPKISTAPTNETETDDDDALHQPKRSSLTLEAANPNVMQQPILQVNSELQSSLHKSQQEHQFGTLLDHGHSESMLAAEHKEKDDISCITPQEEKRERDNGEEHTAEPSSVVTTADANAVSDVCGSDRTEDTVTPRNQSSQSHDEKSYLLSNSEHRQDKAESTECSTLKVEDRLKPQDPDSAKLSKQNLAYKQSISCNPGNFGETQQLDGTYSEPRCSFLYSLDLKKENSKGLLAMQKEGPMSQNIQAREGHIINAGLNLNQEVCVLPRDSRGQFIRSARMNEEKESDIPFAWSKETQSHKPSIKRNTCAIRDESNFAMNAAVPNGRNEESISMQTFIPAYEDCHIVRKPVAQETLFSYPGDETLPAGRQALLPTAALSHFEATSSLNAMDHLKFCMPRDCSDYGYMGLPLDLDGAFVKHFPSMRRGANELHKVPSYMAVNKLLVTEGTKMLQEFNFVETMKTCSNDGHDHWQERAVSKTNQSRHEETCTKQYFPLHQIERDRTHFGGSHTRIAGLSTGIPNTISDLRLCMQTTAESGKHGDQGQKTSALQETLPEVHCTRKQHCTSQSVIRLMGQSFTVGGENEAENDLKDPREGKGNMKIAENTSKVTVGVSPSIQMTAHVDHCNTRNEDKFYWPEFGVNASCREPRGKSNSLKDLMQPGPGENFARDKVNTINENAFKLVEKRLPTNCANNVDQSNSAQKLISTSSSPFSASMLSSPVCCLSKNTCVNEWNKMTYMDSHMRDQGCLLQQQTDSQLLNPCLGQTRFQNPECDGWTYISNPFSCTTQSSLVQPLPCTTNSLRSCDPLHTGIIVHSTSFPTEALCQTTTSSTSIADYASLIMQGKDLYAPIDGSEREKTMLELPNNMNRKRCKTSHEKLRLIATVDLESKCRDDSRTRKRVQETEGLHRKWILKEHENYASGKLSDRIGEIYKTNDRPVECAFDDGITSKRKMDDGCIITAESHTCIPLKSQVKDNEEFRGLNVKLLESQMRTSRIGSHFSNAEYAFKLAEPRKLSRGAKHILKPSTQNISGKQSLPPHCTLPFLPFSGEPTVEKDRNL